MARPCYLVLELLGLCHWGKLGLGPTPISPLHSLSNQLTRPFSGPLQRAAWEVIASGGLGKDAGWGGPAVRAEVAAGAGAGAGIGAYAGTETGLRLMVGCEVRSVAGAGAGAGALTKAGTTANPEKLGSLLFLDNSPISHLAVPLLTPSVGNGFDPTWPGSP